MISTRPALVTAGVLAAVLAVQGLLLALWSTGIGLSEFGLPAGVVFGAGLFWSLLTSLLHYAAFGLGVFLVLRFSAPIATRGSWGSTIVRGIVATIGGAVVAFAFSALVSMIAAVTIGSYPFGYALDAGVDGNRVQYGIQNAVAGALTPLIGWLPITVLAVVLLRLWLAAHPLPALPKDRASVSE
jgi:hypothetical protein